MHQSGAIRVQTPPRWHLAQLWGLVTCLGTAPGQPRSWQPVGGSQQGGFPLGVGLELWKLSPCK